MWRLEQSPSSSGSPRCPDLLQCVGGPRSPLSPLYLSFFEEECRAIATRLLFGDTRPVTSTPLHALPPFGEGAPDSTTPAARPSTGDGTKLKLLPAAKSRPQHPSGALQLVQPFAVPKPRDTEVESAVKVGGHKQPSQRLSTAIPAVASRSRLWPLGKVASLKRFCLDPTSGLTTQELMCSRTLELKENDKSKEQVLAAGTVLGAGKADQTWVCLESSFSSELAPGLTPGCGDAVPAEQSAGDQLSQELKHVKNELERVKSELADKTALCEVYRQMISSLQHQLRAAGICLEDAAVEESSNSGRG